MGLSSKKGCNLAALGAHHQDFRRDAGGVLECGTKLRRSLRSHVQLNGASSQFSGTTRDRGAPNQVTFHALCPQLHFIFLYFILVYI